MTLHYGPFPHDSDDSREPSRQPPPRCPECHRRGHCAPGCLYVPPDTDAEDTDQ